MTAAAASRYDVFLSHNSQDKPLVEQIAGRLVAEARLCPFLDKWHLVPGAPWQPELETALADSATVAVFFGPSGNGPWHNVEMQVALKRAVREKQEFRLIPVVLPEADAGAIPDFLQLRTWVDFRDGIASDIAFKRLVAGIKGLATDFEGIELPDEPAPYRGLVHFDADHARFFFGREQEIGPTKDKPNLVEKLRVNRFVAVVGSSGSGKSSIVRAGLLPRLAQDVIPGSRQWRTITCTPSSDPFRSLANALASRLPAADRGPAVTSLLAQFDEPETGLRNTLETWFADSAAPLLLFVDQFEELFTHAPSAQADAASRQRYDERIGRFIHQVAHEVLRPDGRFRAVITVRADFIPHCLRVPELTNLLQDRQMMLGELAKDDEALREIIQRPAHEVGAMLETGLMEVLLADVHSQSGALPLLEHALSELWRARRGPWLTLDAYKSSGGVGGALRKRAEETLQRLTGPQQQIARRIFVKLTSLEEDTEDARRRVDRQSLYAESADAAEIDAVIDVLAGPEARLIVVDDHSLSIAHETLIRNWPQLRTWLNEDRQLERIHRELERAANDWQANARSKRRLFHGTSAKLAETEEHASALADRITPLERDFLTACRQERDAENRRLRIYVLIMTVITIFAVAAGVIAWNARRASEEARRGTEEALVRGFYRTIGVEGASDGTVGGEMSIANREPLWDLATLPSENARVRDRLVETWFHDVESINRPIRGHGRGWRAVGELNPEVEQQIVDLATEFADHLVTLIETKAETDEFRRGRVEATLVALSQRLDPSDAAGLADRLVTEIIAADRNEFSSLNYPLKALGSRLEPADAARLAERLAVEMTEDTPGNHFVSLNESLPVFAGRLEQRGARQLAERLATALKKATDEYRQGGLDRTLAALAVKLGPADAAWLLEQLAVDPDVERIAGLSNGVAELALRCSSASEVGRETGEGGGLSTRTKILADRLVKTIENQTSNYLIIPRANALAQLVPLLEGGDACDLAKTLVTSMEGQRTWVVQSALSDTLEKVARTLKHDDALPLAERVAVAMGQIASKKADKYTDPLKSLSRALAALAGQLEPQNRSGLAAQGIGMLVSEMESGKVDYFGHENLRQAVPPLAALLESSDAILLAERVTASMKKTNTNTDQPESLSRVMMSLAPKLAPPDALQLPGDLIATMKDAALNNEQPYNRLIALSKAVIALAAKLESTKAKLLAESLTETMERKDINADELPSLGNAMLALASRLDRSDDVEALALRGVKRLVWAMELKEMEFKLGSVSDSLTTLSSRLDLSSDEATRELARGANRIADRMIANETNRFYCGDLSEKLAHLARHLKADDAQRLATGMREAITQDKIVVDKLASFADAIFALTGELEPDTACSLAADRLARLLEDPKETDQDRLNKVGKSLVVLSARLPEAQVLALGERMLKVLEAPNGEYGSQIATRLDTLAGLSAHLEPVHAAILAERLAAAIDNEQDRFRHERLTDALVSLSPCLNSKLSAMRMFAISHFLVRPAAANELEKDERERVKALLHPLDAEQLVEVLKWPFCVGEAEKMVLTELEKRLSTPERPVKFGGDVRKFVAQAESLGITNHKTPAQRPTLEKAREELDALLKAPAAKP